MIFGYPTDHILSELCWRLMFDIFSHLWEPEFQNLKKGSYKVLTRGYQIGVGPLEGVLLQIRKCISSFSAFVGCLHLLRVVDSCHYRCIGWFMRVTTNPLHPVHLDRKIYAKFLQANLIR